jgi:hypothetical protein
MHRNPTMHGTNIKKENSFFTNRGHIDFLDFTTPIAVRGCKVAVSLLLYYAKINARLKLRFAVCV